MSKHFVQCIARFCTKIWPHRLTALTTCVIASEIGAVPNTNHDWLAQFRPSSKHKLLRCSHTQEVHNLSKSAYQSVNFRKQSISFISVAAAAAELNFYPLMKVKKDFIFFTMSFIRFSLNMKTFYTILIFSNQNLYSSPNDKLSDTIGHLWKTTISNLLKETRRTQVIGLVLTNSISILK